MKLKLQSSMTFEAPSMQNNINFESAKWIFSQSDVVDPNRDGQVSLQEYMAFMISKETENVHSSEEIENAFRAITAHQDRAYVTKDELYAVSFWNIFIIFKDYIKIWQNFWSF